MKKYSNHTVMAIALGTVLNLMGAGLVFADDQATGKSDTSEKTFKGIITAVDQQENTVAIKGSWNNFWGTRTFNLAANCQVAMEDKPSAELADLHPGQSVDVRYDDDHGVLIAREVDQYNLNFTGYVTAINPVGRTLIIKHGLFTRNFSLDANCDVILYNDKSGSLDDIKPGHTVTVVYEPVNSIMIVHRIEQRSETFSGTITAIDASTRTVKAQSLMSEKKFSLADGCKIVVKGNVNARLEDLHVGQPATFSYEDADGVLVANCIGCDSGRTTASAQGVVNN